MKKIFYILTPVVDTQTYTCDKTAQILTPTVTEEYKKSWGNLNKSYGLLSMQCPSCDTSFTECCQWGKLGQVYQGSPCIVSYNYM